MWVVDEITAETVTLDFTSSGQGRPLATQIRADGELLANAVEWTDWTGPISQAHICDSCGTELCTDGGWIGLRAVGEHVLLVPAFDQILASDRWPDRYSPPGYVDQRGVPLLSPEMYGRVRAAAKGFPPHNELPASNGLEMARVMQMDAPGQVLGTFPDPIAARMDLVLAASRDLDPAEAMKGVTRCLEELAAAERVGLSFATEGLEPLILYIEARGVPEWTPVLVHPSGAWHLSPAPNCVVTAL